MSTQDTIQAIQVQLGTVNGRRRARYRVQLVTGAWPAVWHRMTVSDARSALQAARAGRGWWFGGALGTVRVME